MANDPLYDLDGWSRHTGMAYEIRGRFAEQVRVTLPPSRPSVLPVFGYGKTLEEAAAQALRLWATENEEGADDE